MLINVVVDTGLVALDLDIAAVDLVGVVDVAGCRLACTSGSS